MTITVSAISPHIIQLAIPTPTLPPAFETNTYIIHDGRQGLLVDAGTTDGGLLRELTDIVRRLELDDVQLLATHYHRDHTQGLPWLQAHYDTPIFIHPLDTQPALQEMQSAATTVLPVPQAFTIGDVQVRVDARPGHTHGHLHLRVYPDAVVLVGDHLAGLGSVWVGPPDGHLSTYYSSLDSLIQGDCNIGCPGHGPVIRDVRQAALHQKEHRQDREQQILGHLADWASLDDLVDAIYRNRVPDEALSFARKTVQATMQYLVQREQVEQRFDTEKMRSLYRRCQ